MTNGWLRGYRRTVSGERIPYHSAFPEIGTALLVRASDGPGPIEWESAPVPEDFDRPAAEFIWMAGLATGKGAHRFSLAIDGVAALDLTTAPDPSRRSLRVEGPGGVILIFETALVDQFDELFGFMRLTVPAALLRPGKPLTLRITGESAGSRDWVMVFEDELVARISAKAEQALVRRDGELRQVVRTTVAHFAPPAWAVASIEGGDEVRTRLETGQNEIMLTVPALDFEIHVDVFVDVEGGTEARVPIALKPVSAREIWLLPHSHVDIGYSGPQPEVEKNHWRYYEEAIRLAEATAAYPEGARFKWNVEQLWAVETYLAQADAPGRERFFEAVGKGWIGLQAVLAGELTGLCHPEELFEITAFARRIEPLTGKTVDSAMVTDIPSQSWSLVPALALAGVRYVSSGPNYIPSLPDGGDRIGRALESRGDRPFYWESPSGKERVLFWMAGRGYSWFHGLNMGNIERAPRSRIFDYLEELAARRYPYSMVQVRYTVGGDNGPPDPELADFVRIWNQEYESPKIVIASSSEMFAEFERRHGKELPVVRGDFTPYWEDGAASTARETGLNRAAAERLVEAQALWSMVAPEAYPAAKFYEAWRQVVLFDEHTWGAADSVSDPDRPDVAAQWEYKKAIGAEADRLSRELAAEALARHAGEAVSRSWGTVDVFNTCSWPRTGLALVPKGLCDAGDTVRDDADVLVPAQRLTTGELAFLAEDVPALGARRYFVGKGRSALIADRVGTARVDGNVLVNDLVSLTLDPATGAISGLKRSADGAELVDTSKYPGLNHYLYVPGRDPSSAQAVGEVRIEPGETGPLVASLVVLSDAPGARSLRREVRVVAGSERIEVIDTLDKTKVRGKESVHIAFPFRVDGGTVRVDAGWGSVVPGRDQIEGSCLDFFCAQKGVDISNDAGGVTWTPLDAPLVEVGAPTDESLLPGGGRRWRASLEPSSCLFSYVMNNYWHTNYKADQEGPVTLRYAVEPHAGGGTATAKRLAMEACRPLIAAPAAPSGPVPGLGLSPLPASLVVTSVKPAEDGRGLILHVFNAGPRAAALDSEGLFLDRRPVFLSGLREERAEEAPAGLFDVPAFGIVILRAGRPA